MDDKEFNEVLEKTIDKVIAQLMDDVTKDSGSPLSQAGRALVELASVYAFQEGIQFVLDHAEAFEFVKKE